MVQDGCIIRWITSALTDTDLQVLGVSRGDCRGQGAFEALAICVAMREWLPLWQDESTSILVKSDSMAALGALNREGSSKPLINKVVREIALDLAEGVYDVEVLGHQPAAAAGVAADRQWRVSDTGHKKFNEVVPDGNVLGDRAFEKGETGLSSSPST